MNAFCEKLQARVRSLRDEHALITCDKARTKLNNIPPQSITGYDHIREFSLMDVRLSLLILQLRIISMLVNIVLKQGASEMHVAEARVRLKSELENPSSHCLLLTDFERNTIQQVDKLLHGISDREWSFLKDLGEYGVIYKSNSEVDEDICVEAFSFEANLETIRCLDVYSEKHIRDVHSILAKYI